MIIVVILLFSLGVRALVARIVLVYGDDVELSILQGNRVSDDDLATLHSGRQMTASWFPTNASYNALALVALDRSSREEDKVRSASYLGESIAWQQKALYVSPADPYGWYRLSYLYYVTEGATPRAVAAWKQSLNAAPYEPRLMVTRLQMAMSLGDTIDAETRGQLPRMVREAWEEDPDLLVRAAKDGAFISFVESAMADESVSLSQFRRLLQSIE